MRSKVSVREVLDIYFKTFKKEDIITRQDIHSYIRRNSDISPSQMVSGTDFYLKRMVTRGKIEKVSKAKYIIK